jgi:hypothetical protein
MNHKFPAGGAEDSFGQFAGSERTRGVCLDTFYLESPQEATLSGVALGNGFMSKLWHENECNESVEMIEISEKRNGLKGNLYRSLPDGLGSGRGLFLLETMNGGPQPIAKGFFHFRLGGGFVQAG